MTNLVCYLFEFLILTSATAISPVVFFNSTKVVDPLANRPVVGSPDPRFKTEVSFNGPRLPLISCLMNTVEFLMIFALQDFSGNTKEVAWKLDEYPEVGMVISPSTEDRTIEIRFVVWGLSQGAAQMIHLNRWQAVTFTLSCTYSLLLFFPTQMTFESGGHILLTGSIYPSQRDPSTCLSTLLPTKNCER